MLNVYIIAGGPGDPELITLKGKKIIDISDYIFMSEKYLSKKMFSDIKPECVLLDNFEYTYDEKLEFIKNAISTNKIVSFITMGDPALYGMVSGLIDRLEKNDIDFEIIPGVNAALASSAILKRGLTGLGITNTSVCTSYNDYEKSKENLEKIADLDCSVSIFMAIQNLSEIVEIFSRYKSKETPVAIVSKATWKEEKIIKGTLSDITEKLAQEHIDNGLILIGDFLKIKYNYDLERSFKERKKRENEKH